MDQQARSLAAVARFDVDVGMDADRHGPFLGIAERDRPDAGEKIDIQNDQVGLTVSEEVDLAGFVQDLVALRGAPLVLRGDPGVAWLAPGLAELGADDVAMALGFRPEIDTFDALEFGGISAAAHQVA